MPLHEIQFPPDIAYGAAGICHERGGDGTEVCAAERQLVSVLPGKRLNFIDLRKR